MHDKTDLSIVIVTWNSESEIGACLNSIIDNTKDVNYEIVIVDNISSDKTVDEVRNIGEEKFHRITLIENTANEGFTKACNKGIHVSSGRNILLLNPDTIILTDAVKKLIEKLESSETLGAVSPQLLNPDMSIQKSCRTFPEYSDMLYELSFLSTLFRDNIILSRWKMNYFSHDEEMFVEQPMAAALMIKRKVLREIDNFDERYKMFFNDVDICRKIIDKGYVIGFYPDAKVIHEKGVSVYKDRERMIRIWNDDCLSYFKKYHYNIFLYSWLWVSLRISGLLRILFYRLKK
jgi:GT2 family glycosyltransferase